MPKVRPVRAGLAIAAIAMLPALAACGDGASDDPAKSAESFLHALADGDGEKACSLMADEESGPAEPDSSEWSTCVSSVTEAAKDPGLGDFGIAPANLPDEGIAAYSDAKVTGAEVKDSSDGPKASVDREMITGVENNSLEIELRSFDDLWYVTDVDEETG